MSTTRLTRRFAAPPDRLYAAITTAADISVWMVPDGMTSQVHRFDAREDGAFRISLTYDAPTEAGKSDAQTDSYHGRFVELVPGKRVVQAMEFETDDPAMRGEMLVTFALTPTADGGTELVATHSSVPPGIAPADNELGWRLSLDKLAMLVDGRVAR